MDICHRQMFTAYNVQTNVHGLQCTDKCSQLTMYRQMFMAYNVVFLICLINCCENVYNISCYIECLININSSVRNWFKMTIILQIP
jgi:hypothetical protein